VGVVQRIGAAAVPDLRRGRLRDQQQFGLLVDPVDDGVQKGADAPLEGSGAVAWRGGVGQLGQDVCGAAAYPHHIAAALRYLVRPATRLLALLKII
jgi:hypothetical protein